MILIWQPRCSPTTVSSGYLAETKTPLRVLLALVAVPVSSLGWWCGTGASKVRRGDHLLSGWLLILFLHGLTRMFLSVKHTPSEQGEYS